MNDNYTVITSGKFKLSLAITHWSDRTAPGSLPTTGYRGSFPRATAAGAWSWPLTSI